MMRFLTRLNVGGPARQALLLSRGLAIDFPTLLCAGTPAPEEGELLDPDVPVHRIPLVRPISPHTDVRAWTLVRQLLAKERPEILHTHMAKAGAIGRSAALSLPRRPLLVHTFHGHVLDGYFRRRGEQAALAVERRLARHCDAVVAVSVQIRDRLLELGVGRPEQFRVIPLGLDLSRHLSDTCRRGGLRAHIGVPNDIPLVGAVARLVPIKDHATLFAAIRSLPGVHLAVLGDGELRASLEALADSLGIAGRVHFVGWWEDVAAAMGDLDAVALTSKNEGTPVSLIEALACRTPVVASDVGGVPSVVQDGITGYLVPPQDPEAVALALDGLLSDEARTTAMGEAGRDFVRERFSADRLLADMKALYMELLARRQ